MKLSKRLCDWLRQNRKEVPADANEDYFRGELGKAIADGSLTMDKYAELSQDEDAAKADAITSKVDSLADSVAKMVELFGKAVAKPAETAAVTQPTGKAAEVVPPVVPAEKKVGTPEVPKPEYVPSEIEKALAGSGGDGAGMSGTARVKCVSETYETTKSAVVWPDRDRRTGQKSSRAGKPVAEASQEAGERQIYQPSELERAAGGAYLKWAIGASTPPGKQLPRALRMTDHDKQLVEWALGNAKWGGVIHGGSEGGSEAPGSIPLEGRKLSPHEQKSLIDDTLTGGLEAAPIFFDDAVILDPLLTGELFPRVNVVNITRGRRIEAASFGNVTVKWGGGDDDPIDLFDTTGYITAFDTLIHVVDGAIELGLDFLSDSPLRVMDIVTAQYSQRLLETLDEQIAIGDGAQEPEGIVNATGIVNVSWLGATGIGNYESLLFGVKKRFKQGFSMDNMVFCGSEQSYMRARGIPHSGTGTDNRRIFGLDEETYMLFGHPYAICEPMGNRQVFFANMRRYRMYRRLGLTVRSTGEGRELVRRNTWLITARARFGGQLEAGGAAALASDAPV